MTTTQTPIHYILPYEQVLIDSGISEEHWPEIKISMQRQLNMCGGRPSDCMSSAIWSFKRKAQKTAEAKPPTEEVR